MDTLTNIPANNISNFESIHIAEISDEERRIFTEYVDLVRDISESNQLFEVFYFNLLNMRNNFIFNTNDTVKATEHLPSNSIEYIAVNTFVINIISSAQTLIEFLRLVSKHYSDINTSESDEFNSYISDIYENSYSYRVLINLRHFVQHGHLPVSFQDGRYSFDVNQLLDTPHFNIKEQLKTDLQEFLDKNQVPKETIACLALTLTVAKFTVQVIEIYLHFLLHIKKSLLLMHEKTQQIVKEKPNIICNYNETLNGHIIYDSDDKRLHAFKPDSNTIKSFEEAIKRVNEIKTDEDEAWDIIYNHLKKSSNQKIINDL